MTEQQSHWWPVDSRYTVCGEYVTRDTVCNPKPTCRLCADWLRMDAEALARQLTTEKKDEDADGF
jgi:hypothetical protein